MFLAIVMHLNTLLQLVLTYKAGSPGSQERSWALLCSCALALAGKMPAVAPSSIFVPVFFFSFTGAVKSLHTHGFCSVLPGIEPIFTTAAGWRKLIWWQMCQAGIWWWNCGVESIIAVILSCIIIDLHASKNCLLKSLRFGVLGLRWGSGVLWDRWMWSSLDQQVRQELWDWQRKR